MDIDLPNLMQPRLGPRSLTSMCIRKLAANIEGTCAADLKAAGIPFRVLERLWSRIENITPMSRRVSLETWVTVSEAFRHAYAPEHGAIPLEFYKFARAIQVERAGQLSSHTLRFIKLGTDYLVSLKIDGLPSLDTAELLPLARLRNLDTLDIVEGLKEAEATAITDSLVRGWSEVEGAFPALTFLRLRPGEADGRLTRRSLGYISAFPLLRVFDLRLPNWSTTSNAAARAEAELEGMHEYPSCGWECISSGSRLSLVGPYIEHLAWCHLDTVYRARNTQYVPPGLADVPSCLTTANRGHVVRTPGHGPSHGPGHEVDTRWDDYFYLHNEDTACQSFWRSALMDSMPPISRDRGVNLPIKLPLPPKPYVSMHLVGDYRRALTATSYRAYIFHRRPKLASSETRGLIRVACGQKDTENLPWHELEKSLANQGQGRGKRKAVAESRAEVELREGERQKASADAKRARQRQKFGMNDIGDLFRGPYGGTGDSGGGSLP
ncbi:hypothetical protein QBC39DRAFT_95890 [Podospora conica]|nr:hypothetical protein QBC39DRAFT_95890 [Schizothecium conicum]